MGRGSGSLGTIGLQTAEESDYDLDRLDVSKQVTEYLQSRELTPAVAPLSGARGLMPIDLLANSDADLGDLLHNLSQYIGYVDSELANAYNALDAAKIRLKFLTDKLRVRLNGSSTKRITDKDKSAQIDTDKRVIDAQIVVLTYEGITRITTTIKKQAELNWDTVSRIITQRGQEVERMKRGHSVDGIRAPQYKPGINRPTRR